MAVKAQLDRLAGVRTGSVPGRQPVSQHSARADRARPVPHLRPQGIDARGRTYPAGSPERESLDKDLERISHFLDNEIAAVGQWRCRLRVLSRRTLRSCADERPDRRPLAVYRRSTPSLSAGAHRIAASGLRDRPRRYERRAHHRVRRGRNGLAAKTSPASRPGAASQGGWSQARYQRHIENFHLQHIKEVVEALEKIVQRESIPEIVFAGDEVVLPLLREQMPKHLQQKVVEHVRMNINSPLEQLIGSSLDALRRARTEGEREKVDAAVGGFRSGGLGVIGPEDTLEALVKGQVDELLISSQLRSLQPVRRPRRVDGRRQPRSGAARTGAGTDRRRRTGGGRCGDGSPRRRARDQGDADRGEDHLHRAPGPARRLRRRRRAF